MSEAKKIKMDVKKIGTHDGIFHCDEVLACFMLKQLPEYKNAEIVRTRKQELLDECDIVVDVGSEFNVQKNRFDHHQKSFDNTLNDLKPEMNVKSNIKLSSAGLIYTYFGERIICEILHKERNYKVPEKNLKKIYQKVYDNFINEIDGIDNGVPMCEGTKVYDINTNLSKRVGAFNPEWNEEVTNIFERFSSAMELAGKELIDSITYYSMTWLPARDIVLSAIEKRFDIHESGEIIELEKMCPWKSHLFEIEQELNIEGKIKYVIGLSDSKTNDWRIICTPIEPNSFILRKPLPSAWRGIRDEELAKVSNISDIKFCHNTGFIGGAFSRESVLKMAIKSLEING